MHVTWEVKQSQLGVASCCPQHITILRESPMDTVHGIAGVPPVLLWHSCRVACATTALIKCQPQHVDRPCCPFAPPCMVDGAAILQDRLNGAELGRSLVWSVVNTAHSNMCNLEGTGYKCWMWLMKDRTYYVVCSSGIPEEV